MIRPAFFYIPVNFAFNLPHYVTSCMHHKGKKKQSKKEILIKEKNKVTKHLLRGDPNADPQNQLEPNVNASIHWTTFVNANNWSLNEVHIPFLW